jgi:hypothetical protein
MRNSLHLKQQALKLYAAWPKLAKLLQRKLAGNKRPTLKQNPAFAPGFLCLLSKEEEFAITETLRARPCGLDEGHPWPSTLRDSELFFLAQPQSDLPEYFMRKFN